MSARRLAFALVAAALLGSTAALPAVAALREVSIGNYYFQDDATGSRAQIVVERGDQIRFTVRESAFSPHSVNVDELGIRSGDLQLFDTFTTPPLDAPGTYRLYCQRHQNNPGQPHVAELVVRNAAAPSTTRPATVTTRPATVTTRPPAAPSAPSASSTTAPRAPGPTSTVAEMALPVETTAPPSTVPSGRGVATDRRRLPPAEGSLADILGRRPEPGPWTRALGLASVLFVAMTAAVAFAVLRGRRA